MVSYRTKPLARLFERVLVIAAIYHFTFSAFTLWDPFFFFHLFGVLPLWPPVISYAIAFSVALLGIAFIAAVHFPKSAPMLVGVGLLAKIVPPILWYLAFVYGIVPLSSAVLIFFNDMIWWAPFVLILFHCFRLKRPSFGPKVN